MKKKADVLKESPSRLQINLKRKIMRSTLIHNLRILVIKLATLKALALKLILQILQGFVIKIMFSLRFSSLV